MGNVEAKNEIDNKIQVTNSIINKTLQQCKTDLSQNQLLQVFGCRDIDISHINFKQAATIDVACVQKSSASTDISTQIENNFKQAATAVNQALNFTPGSTKAENVTRLTQDLATVVQNTFSQNCTPSNAASQSLIAACSGDGGTANIHYINFDQYSQAVVNCTQQSDAVTTVANSIKNVIDQSAVAKVESIFGPLAGIIAILLIFMLGFFLMGGKILTTPMFWVTVIIVIILYLGLAYYNKWMPFPPPPNS